MNTLMKIHPLMLAAAIAFWGWQMDQWLVAMPIAVVLGASFVVSLRWALTSAHLMRVADFCTVLALLLGAYLYLVYGNPLAVILFFKWLPVMFLPLALAHAYGTTERMNLAVLFWSLRRRPPARPATFDPWWPYYALWIVAAAAANGRGEGFYLGLVALVSWPLVRVRPWCYRVGTWGISFSLAVGMGYGLYHGLNKTQTWLENAVPDWITAAGSRTDPYRATTDIGHIGKLKESDAIVLRVTTPDGREPPRLLHRASYNTYFNGAWLARGATFAPLPRGREHHWPLHSADAAGPVRHVTVHDYSTRPNPVLSLPTGAHAIEGLRAITAQRNGLGAIQVSLEPGYFSYTAAYSGDAAHDGAPMAEDTRLPPKEREAFAALAAEMGLAPQRAGEALEAVQQLFAHDYHYATFQKSAPPPAGSPIIDFLLRSKTGHCEYFATATVLLLRAGGIPARYATGFVAAEKSERENAYLVRTRHAHAWARAYVNGRWIDIDTTPPSWFATESEGGGFFSSGWSKFTDLWSWLHFRASQAWANGDERRLLTGALIVVFPFALWLAWRLFRSRKREENIELKQSLKPDACSGADSEFYRVEQQLAAQGWGRRTHETAHDWLARLKADAPVDTAPLAEMVELHNRYRFDPLGLSVPQRARLRESSRGWLARHTGGASP